MFIINGKSHCCNDTFTDVQITSLLVTNIFKKYKLFYAVRISISLAILSEIFIQIGHLFKSYARKQKWMFFSEHRVQLNTEFTTVIYTENTVTTCDRPLSKLDSVSTCQYVLPELDGYSDLGIS